MNPWRSRQPAHRQIQAMRETAHSFRKSTAQRRLRSWQLRHRLAGIVSPLRTDLTCTTLQHRCHRTTSGKLQQERKGPARQRMVSMRHSALSLPPFGGRQARACGVCCHRHARLELERDLEIAILVACDATCRDETTALFEVRTRIRKVDSNVGFCAEHTVSAGRQRRSLFCSLHVQHESAKGRNPQNEPLHD